MRHHYFAARNEILLDLDNRSAIKTYRKNITRLQSKVGIRKIIETPSKTYGHIHVLIQIEKRLELRTIIEWSLVLGSDRKRYQADLARLSGGATKPMLLIHFGDKINGWRQPELSCNHDVWWRSCPHLQKYQPHKWKYGTKTQNPDLIRK